MIFELPFTCATTGEPATWWAYSVEQANVVIEFFTGMITSDDFLAAIVDLSPEAVAEATRMIAACFAGTPV